MTIDVQILGPLRVLRDGHDVTPTAPKPRTVLTLLALHAGRLVPSTTLMDELWGEGPPCSASTTLQTYVYQIRKLLQPDGTTDRTVETRNGGYVMSADTRVDVNEFRDLTGRGRQALAGGDLAEAVACLRAATHTWRGRALTDVNVGQALSTLRVSLDEDLLQVHEMRIETEQRLGHDRELVPELRRLVADYPLHEDFSAHLMMALHRAGRRGEALQVYRDLRRLLHTELGVEPATRLQRLHRTVLSSDDARDAPVLSPLPIAPMPAPAQLPAEGPALIGRERARDRVRAVLSPGEPGWATRIAVVTGPAGVGKTSLAVRAGHHLRALYPDGQFYAGLRRPDGRRLSPGEALDSFLRGIGLPADRIPADVESRSALFRSWTADRKVFVLLDGVHESADVLHLLPGGSGSAVLITSARPLPGLSGAVTLRLGRLGVPDGLRLLEDLAGADRVRCEPDAAREVVEQCEGLPAALSAAGGHLAVRPRWSVRRLADLLGDEEYRLSALDDQGLGLRARISTHVAALDSSERAAVHALSAAHAGMFRLRQAADLMTLDVRHAEALLNRLVQASVLIEHEDADGSAYRLPCLVRLHARQPGLAA